MTPKDASEIQELMESRRTRRLASQPLDKPSCGSVFRNPEGMNAWELDRVASATADTAMEVLKYQASTANFILNVDHATAAEYLALVQDIQAKVKEKYGVELRTEMEKFNWK